MDLSPVIQQGIFQDHPLWQKEGESRTGFVHHKQAQFLAQLSVIALFGLFHHGDVGFQLFLFGKGGSVQPGKHLVMLVAPPVRPCQAHDLEGFAHALGAHQVGAGAQVHKLTLAVKADFRIFRQVFNQLHFVGFTLFLHIGDGFLPGLGKTFDF